MTADDGALLDAWRAGDTSAGDELLERHFTSVYRFFSSKLNHLGHDIDDLAQRTFLVCLERRDHVWTSSGIRAYLLGIARMLLLEHFRVRYRDRGGSELVFEETSLAEVGSTPSQHVAAKETQKLVLLAMRHIPIDYQIALELYYWEDLTINEIASVLDVPTGTVKARLSRAKNMLRDRIASLEASAEVRRSTLEDLEHWARSVRTLLTQPSDRED